MQTSRSRRNRRPTTSSPTPAEGRFFTHPEPPREPHRIWPVYLTYLGCPGRCVFCAQHLQSASPPQPPAHILETMERQLRLAGRDGRGPYELALYGGVFTALPDPWPGLFLAAAARLRADGLVATVRCSTRPDACDPDRLARLAGQGLDLVELGAQSFDDTVLTAAGRGHDAAANRAAAVAVRRAGLGLGLQLLPGLPGHTREIWRRDVAETVAIAPDIVRIHPCLVPDGTALAALYRAGRFVPWELEATIEALAEALPPLWRAGSRVVRLGLAPQPGFEAAILAGPRHPALGARVRARALFRLIAAEVRELGAPPAGLAAPRRFSGELFGHAGELVPAYADLGLPRETVRFEDRDDFFLAAGR